MTGSALRRLHLLFSAVTRKVPALIARATRAAARWRARQTDYKARPPVVVISVPKSGTHLVHQIVRALPGTIDYGSFLATRSSYRRQPRSRRAQIRRVRALAPGEILRSHIVYDTEIVKALKETGAFVVFVHRDPRDVVVSEAHYLTDMAPWNVLHREFTRRGPAERIDLAIDGLASDQTLYADIGTRFDEYAGWLDDADVVLQFEDLASDQRRAVIEHLAEVYGEFAGVEMDAFVDTAQRSIDPKRSHTFREGKVGAYTTVLSPEQLARLEATAGETLKRYGYAISAKATRG